MLLNTLNMNKKYENNLSVNFSKENSIKIIPKKVELIENKENKEMTNREGM